MISLKSTLAELNGMNKGTIMEQLGIEYTEAGEGLVRARMPVDRRTVQPEGILHGGASACLAETIGGLGSALLVDPGTTEVRGAALSANHTGTAISGYVFGEARILHRGKHSHVWNIEIRDEDGKLVSTSRLTNILLPRKKE
ncbi:MAG: hotdog fold thioesterase [Bacteroidales bacterium]|nr:hotdog fold thioesterase [Bacteroidales bacterium]